MRQHKIPLSELNNCVAPHVKEFEDELDEILYELVGDVACSAVNAFDEVLSENDYDDLIESICEDVVKIFRAKMTKILDVDKIVKRLQESICEHADINLSINLTACDGKIRFDNLVYDYYD